MGQLAGPMGLRQNLPQRQRVHVHHAVLQEVQRQNGDLVILASVAGELAAPSKEDDVIADQDGLESTDAALLGAR